MTDGGGVADMEWNSGVSSDLYFLRNLSSGAISPPIVGSEKVGKVSLARRCPGHVCMYKS